jgi:hypothetical protein
MNFCSLSSVLGIIGTILGTFLGFFLQRISRLGEIKVFQNSLALKIYESDEMGGYINVLEVTKDEDDFYSLLDFDCDFYNSSESSNMIARDINLSLKTGGKTINRRFGITKTDNKSGTYPDLVNLNLTPKQLVNYQLKVGFQNMIFNLNDVSFKITYKDKKNKLREIKIDNKLLNQFR